MMKNTVQTSAKSLLTQGWQALKNNNMNDAISLSQKLNQLHPGHSEAWYYTAQVAIAIDNKKAAEQALKNACKLAADNVSLKIILVNFYLSNNDVKQAKTLLLEVETCPLKAAEHNQLGLVFAKLQLIEPAIAHYQKAITLDSKNHEHYYSLATVLRFAGDLALAEQHLDKAITLEPLDIDAHVLKVDLKKQSPQSNSISSLTELLTKNLSIKDRVQVYFALAKSYEDLANYQQSFSYLQQGNELRRQHINYQVETDITTMSDIRQIFNQSWWNKPHVNELKAQKSSSTITPIFVLGMPRTGSTLTERILSASDNVFSAGEINDFASCLTAQVNQYRSSAESSKKSFICAASQIDFDRLGDDYLASVTARFSDVEFGDKVNYVIDKLPFNYLYLGLIKKALPHAKIVHVTRNPMDTCYAVYKTLFQQAYPFSYQQQELAHYFIAYQQLMAHWSQLSDVDIHHLSYEDLVADPKVTAKKLYQFCGLDWQDQYTDIKAQQGLVTTASASQVRQDIHQHSLQKWKHYQQQLAPLKAQLEQAGICCD
jgi:tetratricopeptide (TPR) repeat protein